MKHLYEVILILMYRLAPMMFFGGFLMAIIGAEDLALLLISFAVMTIGYVLWSLTEKILLRRLER